MSQYFDLLKPLMNEPEYGFVSICKASGDFKAAVLKEIKQARCSLGTARTFLEFVECELKKNSIPVLKEQMLGAAVFVGNICGLDPTRYCNTITPEDIHDLQVLKNWTPPEKPNVCQDAVIDIFKNIVKQA